MGFRFADLFAGIGGFHAALAHAGGRCAYVSEKDIAALDTYRRNWDTRHAIINTDLTRALDDPRAASLQGQFDVLTAGFPCQPFSKAGRQAGLAEERGGIFWDLLAFIDAAKPTVIMLENVRNITGPNHAREWETIIDALHGIGYAASGQPCIGSPHLLPPSAGGTPQNRERVFILGIRITPDMNPSLIHSGGQASTPGWDPDLWRASWILRADQADAARYQLTAAEQGWVDHWDRLVAHVYNQGEAMPSFPLWADTWQPGETIPDGTPKWKQSILAKNNAFYWEHAGFIDEWKRHPVYEGMPKSRRKLEWQAGGLLSLRAAAMQFRPSGIRAKAPTTLPALVAVSQTPVLNGRRITPAEAARLQGFPETFRFPAGQSDAQSYKQIGNAVHPGVAFNILKRYVLINRGYLPEHLVDAFRKAPGNPSPGILAAAAYKKEQDLYYGII